MNMRSEQEDSINDYLQDTIASVFNHVYYAPVPGTTNMEVYATNSESLPEDFAENIRMISDEELRSVMNEVYGAMEEYEGGDLILTDDKAPVELLGMKVLDEIIGNELEYYKELYLG